MQITIIAFTNVYFDISPLEKILGEMSQLALQLVVVRLVICHSVKQRCLVRIVDAWA